MSQLHFESRGRRSGLFRRPRATGRRHQPAVDLLEGRQLLASLATVNVPITAVEGTSFTGQVARFTDADKSTDPTQFVAQIDWGDGHVTTGTITPDSNPANGFDVTGTNTFAKAGPVSVVVRISDKDGDSASVQTTSIVADAPLTASGMTVNATQNQVLSNAVVATFTDANPQGMVTDFAATIDWGDGTTSAGTIVKDPSGGGVFDVKGSHTFTAPGAFAVQAQIRDGGAGVTSTQFFTPVNLVSDGSVPADHIDPNLVNPWGITDRPPSGTSPGSPFWVSDNGTGVSTLYDGTGTPNPLVVTIPGPNGSPSGFTAAPTGTVANANANEFLLPPPATAPPGTKGPSALFMFAAEDGTITGWNPGSVDGLNNAVLEVDNSTQVNANGSTGAVYKGLALASNGGSDFLYATNFRSGNIDVFDNTFKPVTQPTGAFHDPTLPAGFAPFGIQNINGNLYVTFAKQDPAKFAEVDGAGLGFVDVFSPAGFFLQRIGGTTTQPEMNAPWGLAMAPANFGKFSGDLLVGNLGDSHVNAFDPISGAFLGQLSDAQGKPLVLDGGFNGPSTRGLWGLRFGNGNGSGPTNTLFFTSGFNNETNGVLGAVTANSVSTATGSSIAQVDMATGSSMAQVDAATGSSMAQVDAGRGSTSTGLVPISPSDMGTAQGSVKKHGQHAHFDAALAALRNG